MLIKSRLCIAGIELTKGSLGIGKLEQCVPQGNLFMHKICAVNLPIGF